MSTYSLNSLMSGGRAGRVQSEHLVNACRRKIRLGAARVGDHPPVVGVSCVFIAGALTKPTTSGGTPDHDTRDGPRGG